MNSDEQIKQLKHEIDGLRAEIAELFEVIKIEGESTTKHIDQLYGRIADSSNYAVNNISTLYDIVTPIEAKIFPKVSKARQQLLAIVKKPEGSAGVRARKKK
jgi:hypothetical protein